MTDTLTPEQRALRDSAPDFPGVFLRCLKHREERTITPAAEAAFKRMLEAMADLEAATRHCSTELDRIEGKAN